MKIKLFIYLIISVLVVLLVKTSQSNTDVQTRPMIENYKNLAYCLCLDKFYPEYDSLLNDGSAAGFFQISDISISNVEKLDSLSAVYAKEKYSSQREAELGIMRCLDFYNSDELKDFIESQEFLDNQ